MRKLAFVALILTAIPLVGAASEGEPRSETVLGFLSKYVSLQQSYQRPGRTQPAQFGYSKSEDSDGEVLADFYLAARLVKETFPFAGGHGSPFVSVEGHLSSADGEADDAWTFRLGLENQWVTGCGLGLFGSLNSSLEADRDFDTEYLFGEFVFTPTIRTVGMGKAIPRSRAEPGGSGRYTHPPVQMVWRPFFEFAAGRRIKGEIPSRDEKTLIRLRPRVTATVLLNFLTQYLGFYEASLYWKGRADILPNEEEAERTYFDTGAVFKLNANLSVTFDYSRGERAPWYVEENDFSVMFGVELKAARENAQSSKGSP